MKNKKNVSMVDMRTPLEKYGELYKSLVSRVIDSGAYIGSPGNPYITELESNLEQELFCKATKACVCNSGTTALIVALLAAGVSPGDEVILPDFNFIAGAEAVVLLGARPIFVDVHEDTYLMDFDKAIDAVNAKTTAIIVTDLFGQFPKYSNLLDHLEDSNIVVIEDGAQSFGAFNRRGEQACIMGHIGTTSFYPVKPLGALGEGGAIFSDNPVLIERSRIIINHGSKEKYEHIGLGFNGRLNAIQAATVNFKFKNYFYKELNVRREIAKKYMKALPEEILPKIIIENPSWAQFTIKVPERDRFRKFMSDRLIATDVHYPKTTSQQGIYGSGKENNKNSEFLVKHVVSIPVHPYLTDDDVQYVIDSILEYLEGCK
jgi:UDP-2-acetamido-2-deoxy-ribo-hexuluronate aminotransferase